MEAVMRAIGAVDASDVIAALALLATIALGIWTNRKNAAAEQRQTAMIDALQKVHVQQADLMKQLVDRTRYPEVDDDRRVAWTAEHVGKNRWVLRNVGGIVATNVRLDGDGVGLRADVQPELPADIEPGASITLLVIAGWGAPAPNEIRLTFGDNETAVVPLPRWQ